MLSAAIISKIRKIVGNEKVLDTLEDRLCYAYDASKQNYLPDAVILPDSAAEVDSLMQLADKEIFPVTPRGAGTGMTGGSLAVRGGVILALSRLNHILDIDEENLTAIVEPGVVTADFQKEVEKYGLFYPPDPSSSKVSTLGGNVAECAGGPRGLKYGVTKDYVLGLELVLPTGGILKTGGLTKKGVAGYDLTKLFVGSEGTLGIITKIFVKLIPLPKARRTLLVTFRDLNTATTAVSAVIKARILPAALEFMDRSAISCVEEYLHMGLPEEINGLLLIEVDGREESVTAEVNEIQSLCRKLGAREVRIASNAEEAAELWKARRAISPAVFRLKPDKISEDIVVPRSRIADMVKEAKGIGERNGVIVICFGHAGDGNIHTNIMFDRKDKDELRQAEEARKEIFEAVLKMGGTISGEHGIGITKAAFLDMELAPLALTTMKKIKACLDPNNVLNPGKIFR